MRWVAIAVFATALACGTDIRLGDLPARGTSDRDAGARAPTDAALDRADAGLDGGSLDDGVDGDPNPLPKDGAYRIQYHRGGVAECVGGLGGREGVFETLTATVVQLADGVIRLGRRQDEYVVSGSPILESFGTRDLRLGVTNEEGIFTGERPRSGGGPLGTETVSVRMTMDVLTPGYLPPGTTGTVGFTGPRPSDECRLTFGAVLVRL